MKSVAIIGAGGFIGEPLYQRLASEFDVTGTYESKPKPGLKPLDITNPAQVNLFFDRYQPQLVIHLAAITDVDRCEREPQTARLVHINGTQNIVQACEKISAYLIYVSTEFVFDGQKGNYSETDSANPINVYGKTKLEGEKMVSSLASHCIVRTATPYSANTQTKKFLGQVIEKLSHNEPVTAFDDLIRSPTLVENLVDNFPRLLKKQPDGILHLAGASRVSMYEAALQTARIFGFDESLVKKTSSLNAKLDAVRPRDASLNVSKAKKMGFELKTLSQGLAQIKKQIRARK